MARCWHHHYARPHDPSVPEALVPVSGRRTTERAYGLGALLDPEDGLGLGPVLLETVIVALGRREDVHDDRAVVEQYPMRCGRALTPDGADLLVPKRLDDAVRDRVELALRAT